MLVPLELWFIQRSRSEAITSRRVIELASEALADQPTDRLTPRLAPPARSGRGEDLTDGAAAVESCDGVGKKRCNRGPRSGGDAVGDQQRP
jgi:hypothetical protein